MKDNVHTVIYTLVLGVVCAALLTGVAQFTEPYRKSNARAEKMRSVLTVLGVPFDPKVSVIWFA